MSGTVLARLAAVILGIAVLASALLSAVPAGAAGTPEPSPSVGASIPGESPRPTVMIGVSGLTWGDVSSSATPNLYRAARSGSIASLTPRSVGTTSCPVDGWLAMSAGARAADESRGQCRTLQAPVEGQVPNWDVYLDRAAADNYNAPMGLLADYTADRPTTAIGPGAAVALADADGEVENWSPVPGDASRLGGMVAGSTGEDGLVMLDLGNAAADGYSLTNLDRQMGAIYAAIGDDVDVVFASISDGGSVSHMQVTIATGAGWQDSLLTSRSTRQPGLIQATDLSPTLLKVLAIEAPDTFTGAPVQAMDNSPASGAERLHSMVDRETAVQTQLMLSQWFFPVYASILLALLLASIALARVDYPRVQPWLRTAGLFLTTVPVSTFLVNLVPWERSTNPDVAMIGALLGFALALTILALQGPWRRLAFGPLGVVSILTVLILAADVVTGSRLQMSTLMGEPLLIASRFYGIGNSAFALFATTLVLSMVFGAQYIARPRWRVAMVLGVGLLACVLLGTPGLGSKFGSIPTLVVGLSAMALGAAGIRLSIKRVALILGTAGGLMALMLFLDWLRPADQRTHFGRFFATILDGEAGAVLMRKIGMNIDILTQSWMTLLLPIIVGAVFWVLLQPSRFRLPQIDGMYSRVALLKTGMVSIIALLVVGTIINDSGIVVPAVGILFLIPGMAHLIGQYDDPRRAGSRGVDHGSRSVSR